MSGTHGPTPSPVSVQANRQIGPENPLGSVTRRSKQNESFPVELTEYVPSQHFYTLTLGRMCVGLWHGCLEPTLAPRSRFRATRERPSLQDSSRRVYHYRRFTKVLFSTFYS